jgi:RHS repeat-associated protein
MSLRHHCVASACNARGERVVRAQSTFGVVTETRYVYDEGGRLLLELPSKKGASPAEVVWLDDLPVGLIDKNGEVRPIEPDHLGSPRKVIDASRGTALWDWPILGNAFGTAAANDDPDGDGNATTLNLRFPGQQYDAATGLHYNYFRDYDPATGRYVESDPIGLRGGLATYGYAESTPVDQYDANGLRPCGTGGLHTSRTPWGTVDRCKPNAPPQPTPHKPLPWFVFRPCFATVAPFGNCDPVEVPKPSPSCAQKCNFLLGLVCTPVAAYAGDTTEAVQAWLICRAAVYDACKKECENSCG